MKTKNGTAPRIAVIGAGNVGSTLAYTLMLKNLASQIMLIDISTKKEKGEVLDISDALCFVETSCVKSGDFKDAAAADIIVLTAGLGQKTGETRLALAQKNKAIAKSIFKKIGTIKKSAVVIVVANPVDVITYTVQQATKLPHRQIFGSGTSLETARLRTTLSHYLKVYSQNIDGYVLGEHGDSGFVAWSSVSIGGAPVGKFIKSAKELNALEKKVKNEVYEIINRKGATYFGIAMVVTDIIEAVIFNQRKVMPVSTRLTGWNGVAGVCLGVPAVIGRSGVEKIWPLKLPPEEKKKFQDSAKKIKSYL
jgi:L-lactate dehydrogenase